MTSSSRIVSCLLLGVVSASPAVALEPPAQRSVVQMDYADELHGGPSPELTLGGEFTVEMWVRLYEPSNHFVHAVSTLFAKRDAGSHDTVSLYLYNDAGQTPRFLVHRPEGLLEVVGLPLPLDAWCHLAVTLGGGRQSVFVDGAESFAEVPAGAQPPANADGRFVIGGFRGAVRQVRVWSRALTAAEVVASAAAAVTGSEPGLVAAWPLDDGDRFPGRNLGPSHVPFDSSFNEGGGEPVWVRTTTLDQPYFRAHMTRTEHPGALGGYLDLDLDGDLDLISWMVDYATYAPQPLRAYRNDAWSFVESPDGLIASPPPAFHGASRLFTIADFTGDGLDDVLVPDYGPDAYPHIPGGQVHLAVRQPDGSLRDESASRMPAFKALNHGWTSGDVDGDGSRDVVLAAFGDNSDPRFTSRVLLNDGSGRFTEKADWLQAPWTGIPLSVEVVDVDGDQDLDLFFGIASTVHLPLTVERDVLLLNDGHARFSAAPEDSLPKRYRGLRWESYDARAADLDRDGRTDLVITLFETDPSRGTVGERLQLLLSNGDGTFRDASLGIPQGAVNPVGGNKLVRDVNGDLLPDIVFEHYWTYRRVVLLNRGAARFVDVGSALPVNHAGLLPVDVDGDGDIDLAGPQGLWRDIAALEQIRPLDLATWGDYSLCVYPAHLDVPQGKTAPMQVAVNRGGFGAPVELSVTSATAGISFAFSSATIAGDEVVSLSVSAASSVKAGKYPAVVTARSGDAVHSQDIVVIVGREPMRRKRGTQTSP